MTLMNNEVAPTVPGVAPLGEGPKGHNYRKYKKEWYSKKIIVLNMIFFFFKKYVYMIPYQSGINALSVAF